MTIVGQPEGGGQPEEEYVDRSVRTLLADRSAPRDSMIDRGEQGPGPSQEHERPKYRSQHRAGVGSTTTSSSSRVKPRTMKLTTRSSSAPVEGVRRGQRVRCVDIG